MRPQRWRIGASPAEIPAGSEDATGAGAKTRHMLLVFLLFAVPLLTALFAAPACACWLIGRVQGRWRSVVVPPLAGLVVVVPLAGIRAFGILANPGCIGPNAADCTEQHPDWPNYAAGWRLLAFVVTASVVLGAVALVTYIWDHRPRT